MSRVAGGPASVLADDQVLADLVDRITAQLQDGGPADLGALLRQYPDYADQLHQLLPALQALAGAGRSQDVAEAAPAVAGVGRRRLGEFRILREIARGGMGVVYEAEQESLGRRVALKVLPFAAALDARHLQRFKTEAQAAAQLHHTNIVPIFAVGCDQGVHYYAMQYIDGQTVAALIAERRQLAGGRARAPAFEDARTVLCPAPPHASTAAEAKTSSAAGTSSAPERTHRCPAFCRTVANLGVQAAEALEHAHQLGVIHRDIKPGNLLVDGRGNLWVTDFGLARLHGESGVTQTGDVLGTLRYMSPEQALARHGLVDHRADIYGLGMTLYELLTLEPAFSSRDRNELLSQIAWEEVRPPRRLNPAIPVDLETIVLKALAKNVDDRYATAQELADDLQRFLEDKPIKARRPGLLERTRKWTRRHKTVTRAAAVVVVLAVVGLTVSTWLIARQRDEALRSRADAHQAADEMYTEVAEQWLAFQPGLQAKQRDFLLKALRYYERFARDHGADAADRLQAAKAYRRVGDIQHKLGDQAQAEQAYANAITLLKRLANEHPERPELRDELAVCLNHQGNLLRAAGRLPEAETAYRRALTLFDDLAKAHPEVPAYRDGLAGSSNNLGMVWHTLGRRAEAEPVYRQALALFERLTADDPRSPIYRHDLAGCANNLGYLLRDLGRPEEAEKAYERALTLWERLTAEYPAMPAYRQARAAGADNLGVLLAATGRPRPAERAYRQALALRQKLADDFPAVVAFRQELAATYRHLGLLHAAEGQTAEAAAALRQAVALLENLADGLPTTALYPSELKAVREDLELLLSRQDQPSASPGAPAR